MLLMQTVQMISTHTPHARRDKELFNSFTVINISTHTPRAGRNDKEERRTCFGLDFYSHAPCGARRALTNLQKILDEFLLTRPMRGATRILFLRRRTVPISTHTPHARRDPARRPRLHVRPISTHTPHARRDI